MNYSSIQERLKQARIEKDLTLEEVASILGKTKGTVSKYETGDIENLKFKTINQLSELYNVSPAWLMCWTDIKDKNISTNNLIKLYCSLSDEKKKEVFKYMQYLKSLENSDEISDELTYTLNEEKSLYNTDIKIVGQTAAGQPLMYGDSITKDISDLSDVPANADFALTVNGDSMEPLIKNGSIIYIHSQEDVENGTISIVELDGAVTCKKIYKEDNKLKLVSINEKYEPILIEQGNVRILGKVIL